MDETTIPVQELSDLEEIMQERHVEDKSQGAFHIMWKATLDHEFSITMLEDTVDCLL